MSERSLDEIAESYKVKFSEDKNATRLDSSVTLWLPNAYKERYTKLKLAKVAREILIAFIDKVAPQESTVE